MRQLLFLGAMLVPVLVIGGALWLDGRSAAPTVEKWEHGYKTDAVVATRHKGGAFGYSIAFAYPKNPYDSDRAELSDFMEAHGGTVYQGGGYPGAEMYVAFKDVTDSASANHKLEEVMPALSQLITDIGNGKKVVVAKPKPEYEWPNTAPPDKTDPYWEINNNLSVNGTAYKKAEVSHGKWQWIVDQAAMDAMNEREAARESLWQALNHRALTDDELKRALAYGSMLNTPIGVPYNAEEKSHELTEALARQQILRSASMRPASAP